MRNCLTVVFLFIAMTAAAQPSSFSLSVINPPSGKASLLIYDNESSAREIKGRRDKGNLMFSFSVNSPTYAELQMSSSPSRIPLFIENNDIKVRYDSLQPENSPINGSRTNSLFRYILEQCGQRTECLAEYVAENADSPIAAYLTYRYIAPNVDRQTLMSLFILLNGQATSSWHYRKLYNLLRANLAAAEGTTIPSFTYTDASKHVCLIDTMLSDTSYNIIVVGASWCRQCNDALRIVDSLSSLHTVSINIDNDKRLWDSPFLQQLGIDHIPFLILVDNRRTIVARDIRPWELARRQLSLQNIK